MNNLKSIASLVTLCTALAAVAQETTDSAAQDQAAPEIEGIAIKQAPKDKPFHMLPLCRLVEGVAEVQRPGATVWETLEEGRFYPLGCTFRTRTEFSRLNIQFGRSSSVEIVGIASFGTRMQQVGLKDRTVILREGTIKVTLPRDLEPGIFKVTAPGFVATDMTGESTFAFAGTGDGDEATVKCVYGSLAIEGRHFRIPAMRAANEIRIRTSQDVLFTGLYGLSGDCYAKLDQGLLSIYDIETGTEKVEQRTLDWRLSPQTAVRIHRAMPNVGERMAVTVMTFDAAGGLVNRCAFTEGLSAINTGEQGEVAIKQREELAKKKMAENADEVTTEAAPEVAPKANADAGDVE